jgi:hypothetical protein
LPRHILSKVPGLPLSGLPFPSLTRQHAVEQFAALGLPLLEARQRLGGRALDRAGVRAMVR